jgi:hypothetical protein
METLLDQVDADIRVEFRMAEAEFAQRAAWWASAEVHRAIEATLREAAEHPEVFIDAAMLRGDTVEFAQRAAAADLAVRLNLAESTVRAYGATATLLRERLPRLWAWFTEGEVSTQNARAASDIVMELPESSWAEFDLRLEDAARTLAPARFRAKARALREKLHADTLEQRHTVANAERGVWSEHDRDGMGWLNARLSSENLALATANLDRMAFDLFREQDETRTMAQLRADILADLLTGARTAGGAGVTVALTIPVMTLLGHSIEPAMLEGVGPIPFDTARELAAGAPSITRLLTHPITGTVLGMDPNQYRSSAALKRFLAMRDVTCDFPGCGRRAAHCDLDHTEAWAEGGLTTAENLSHRCRKHHTMKHQTKWRVERPPGAQRAVWTSPTGHEREADPPPF